MRFAFLLFLLCLEAFAISAETDAQDKLGPKTPLADAAPEELVARMTDSKVSFKDRCAAADELAKSPPQQVLPALLPRLARGMPEGGFYTSGSREMDRDVPIPWQIYYAVGPGPGTSKSTACPARMQARCCSPC